MRASNFIFKIYFDQISIEEIYSDILRYNLSDIKRVLSSGYPCLLGSYGLGLSASPSRSLARREAHTPKTSTVACSTSVFEGPQRHRVLSPEEQRVKAMSDQAKRLKQQAKQMRAQQQLKSAQAQLNAAAKP